MGLLKLSRLCVCVCAQGHRRMVYSVAWSHDGNMTERCNLFSAGFDNKVAGWKVKFD